ncbi:MAG: hypothetical protein AMXMBFR13_47290 [Phycisphaerae bacterium]
MWHVSVSRTLMILSVSAACLQAGPNLIRNGGFEEGQGSFPGVGLHWETNDGFGHPEVNFLTTATKHSGAWSQYLKAHSTWDLGMLRQVSGYNTVTPGRSYEIRAWVKTTNIVNCAGWYVFGVWWFNNDAVIGESKMPQPAGCNCPRSDGCNHDWQEIVYAAVAPPGANRVAALLTRHTDGDAWYDDVSITEITPGIPQIGLTPTSFIHTIPQGHNLPDVTFTVQNTGGGTLSYSVSESSSWLSVSPTAGTSTGEPDTITIDYSTAGLVLGTHTATIALSDAAASNSPQTLSVEITVVEPPVPGDFDGDRDVDMDDFGAFQACFSGPGAVQTDPACGKARMDGDPDVDQADFELFQRCMTGANVEGSPSCAD